MEQHSKINNTLRQTNTELRNNNKQNNTHHDRAVIIEGGDKAPEEITSLEELNITQSINVALRKCVQRLQKDKQFCERRYRYNGASQVMMIISTDTLGINKFNYLIYSTAVLKFRETGLDFYSE